jgi:hypothetical protein
MIIRVDEHDAVGSVFADMEQSQTMKKLRVYVDTSVIGGCLDPEFQLWSNGLMRDFREGRFDAVLSDITAAEVKDAPEAVRTLHAELVSIAEVLPITEEAVAV